MQRNAARWEDGPRTGIGRAHPETKGRSRSRPSNLINVLCSSRRPVQGPGGALPRSPACDAVLTVQKPPCSQQPPSSPPSEPSPPPPLPPPPSTQHLLLFLVGSPSALDRRAQADLPITQPAPLGRRRDHVVEQKRSQRASCPSARSTYPRASVPSI
ncbi:hypothetical protein FA95DRAFT_1392762 [Auriscalpium vulgare]|uniref:Uncharacterized protein n=1 Tax=Auriscalpium vulgare TaxID=40419 RepID=A0ACB8S8U0_9AGAM|nr:hypothetical protein FA95DRAFT_1392762 [Auriscalpium vulgare]